MSKYVLVETISQFRQRYIIEVPDNHAEVNENQFGCSAITWAEDTVTMEEMKEFSQLWLGETIVSSREIAKEEIVPLCDKDNEYCQSWDDEKKLEVFVTPVGYKRDW
jgi:hypothetical protein